MKNFQFKTCKMRFKKYAIHFRMAPGMWTVTNRSNVSQWDRERGYENGADGNSYPMRVFSAKQNAELKISARAEKDDLEDTCRSPGFRIFLHTPGQLLSSRDDSIKIPFSEKVNILIKPQMIIASDGLRSYSSEQRQCFFSHEHQLRFFKFYTQQNCEMECLSNYTWQECGCVKFSMPSNLICFN